MSIGFAAWTDNQATVPGDQKCSPAGIRHSRKYSAPVQNEEEVSDPALRRSPEESLLAAVQFYHAFYLFSAGER